MIHKDQIIRPVKSAIQGYYTSRPHAPSEVLVTGVAPNGHVRKKYMTNIPSSKNKTNPYLGEGVLLVTKNNFVKKIL